MSAVSASRVPVQVSFSWIALRVSGYQVFPYQALGSDTYGPTLPIRILGPNGRVLDDAGLVDSGADTSAFPLFMMKELGIAKNQCTAREFSGAGGPACQWTWDEDLDARIAGCRLGLKAVFTDTPITLLGRGDFCRRFKVQIHERALKFGVKPYRQRRPRR